MIDFEKDKQDSLRRTDNIQSLADQVEKLEKYNEQLKAQEDIVKKTKEDIFFFFKQKTAYEIVM